MSIEHIALAVGLLATGVFEFIPMPGFLSSFFTNIGSRVPFLSWISSSTFGLATELGFGIAFFAKIVKFCIEAWPSIVSMISFWGMSIILVSLLTGVNCLLDMVLGSYKTSQGISTMVILRVLLNVLAAAAIIWIFSTLTGKILDIVPFLSPILANAAS